MVVQGLDLDLSPMCLGGNVFGWTADRADTFAILDSYVGAGGNMVDVADVYPAWAPGCSGGESEEILGEWLSQGGHRDQVLVATKVGAHPRLRGLSASNIRVACEASLRRLQTDHIDLYYAHYDDPSTPVEETVSAFDKLVSDGLVRVVGVSNFPADRLWASLELARAAGIDGYRFAQYHYNLLNREYEVSIRDLIAKYSLRMLPYRGLASGYLTGKYHSSESISGARATEVREYAGGGAPKVLAALAQVSADRQVPAAAVALAWLRAQPTVAAPIASVSRAEQLNDLLPYVDIDLTASDLTLLNTAAA